MGAAKKTEEKADLSRRKAMTFQELESVYGVQVETIRKWVKRKPSDGLPPLRAFKPGKEILVYVSDFESYLKMFPVT